MFVCLFALGVFFPVASLTFQNSRFKASEAQKKTDLLSSQWEIANRVLPLFILRSEIASEFFFVCAYIFDSILWKHWLLFTNWGIKYRQLLLLSKDRPKMRNTQGMRDGRWNRKKKQTSSRCNVFLIKICVVFFVSRLQTKQTKV